MKKTLAAILAVFLLVSSMPAAVFADIADIIPAMTLASDGENEIETPEITPGSVSVGDVDGDGNIATPKDAMYLARYLAGWDGYDALINAAASDIDNDDNVTVRDAVILARYIAGWEGYEGYFYPHSVTIDIPNKEEILQELENIKDLNGGELPEIMLDEEDNIPGFILGSYSDVKVTDFESAIESLKDIQYMMRFDDLIGEFELVDEHEFKGTHYYTLQQMYHGYRVFGKQLKIVTDSDGNITAMSGDYDPLYGIVDETRIITAVEAYESIKDNYPDVNNIPEMVVYTVDDGYNEYAWKFEGKNVIIVSAVDENILLEHELIVNEITPTTVTVNYNGFQTEINVSHMGEGEECENENILFDSINNIIIMDHENDDYYHSLNNDFPIEAITIYEELLDVKKYYRETLGINSCDKDNPNSLTTAWYTPNLNNATGGAFRLKESLFNHSIGEWNAQLQFDRNNYDEIDCIGHEYTHTLQMALTEGIIYKKETGALMEAYSDVAGELFELFISDESDWCHGEGAVRRDIKHPYTVRIPGYIQNWYYPFEYKGKGWAGENVSVYDTIFRDTTVVHVNSTVISHVLYNIYIHSISGSTSTLRNDTAVMTELLYRAWNYLKPNSGFYDYRMAVLAAARDMKLSSDIIESINKYFDNANIIPESYINTGFNLKKVSFILKDFSDNSFSVKNACLKVKHVDNGFFVDETSFAWGVPTHTDEVVIYTDNNSKATIYLPNGKYKITVQTLGYRERELIFEINKYSENEIEYSLTIFRDSDKILVLNKGTVSDGTNQEPVENAIVNLYEGDGITSGRPVASFSTGSNGQFSTSDLGIGIYTIQIISGLYNVFTKVINFTEVIEYDDIIEVIYDEVYELEPIDTSYNELYFGGSRYIAFHDTSMNWIEAKEYCESLGGHLATVSSEEENDAIKSICTELDYYYLGGSEYDIDGNWQWVTGEGWSFTNWYTDEPNNLGDTQNCLGIWGKYAPEGNGEWGWWDDCNIEDDLFTHGFICEFEDGIAGLLDSGTCGDNLTWILTEDGTLTISGKGDMWDFNGGKTAPWSYEKHNLKKLVLENGITTIGCNAFEGCENLSGSLIIPDTVTSIGSKAFAYCIRLSKLTLSNNLESIGYCAFEGCTGFIGELTLPESLNKIEYWAFYGCTGLTGALKLPGNLREIGFWAFYNCGFSGSVNIPDSTVTITGNPFACMYEITDIIVSEANASFKLIDGILYSIDGKTVISCPAGKTGEITIPYGVTTIGYSAFHGCGRLTGTLSIPDTVIMIDDNAFSGCGGFAGELIIPDSVLEIGEQAFVGCGNITELVLGKNLTSIEPLAFYNCPGITGSLIIPAGLDSIGTVAFEYCNISDVYFLGNAPEIASNPFGVRDLSFTIYHLPTASGWPEAGELWNGYPTAVFEP